MKTFKVKVKGRWSVKDSGETADELRDTLHNFFGMQGGMTDLDIVVIEEE